jgi:hypothetical protein
MHSYVFSPLSLTHSAPKDYVFRPLASQIGMAGCTCVWHVYVCAHLSSPPPHVHTHSPTHTHTYTLHTIHIHTHTHTHTIHIHTHTHTYTHAHTHKQHTLYTYTGGDLECVKFNLSSWETTSTSIPLAGDVRFRFYRTRVTDDLDEVGVVCVCGVCNVGSKCVCVVRAIKYG